MGLTCKLFGHKWKVIYTDDDECVRCKLIRYWPMVQSQKHLWKEKDVY